MKYIEIDSKTKEVLVGRQEQPFMPDLSDIGRECIEITDDSIVINEGDTYNTDGTFTAKTEPVKTDTEKLKELTTQFYNARLKTCKDNGFDDINSMRTHADNSSSVLQSLAIKLKAWETAQINHFVSLKQQIKAGTLDIDDLVFADEFVEFVEADW